MTDKETLRQIVAQQKKDTILPPGTVEREILNRILAAIDDRRILILTGMRRSGKSTLLKQIMQHISNYCYVSFEDERFIDFEAKEFEQLNEVLVEFYGEPKVYFFDEIQNIDKFETFVRRLQDQGKKVIMTGSNASLLSKELGTRLTGRYKSFEVYPFTFGEYLVLKGVKLEKKRIYLTEHKVRLLQQFEKYLSEGGLPEYLKTGDDDYVRTVYENILYRDIIARYAIRKQRAVRELANMLAANIASEFSYNSLKNALGLSNMVTVKEYISHFNDSYLFFELQRFDYSVRRQLALPKKAYVVDPAFSRLLGLNFSANKGRVLEDIVFIQMKRERRDVYYYSGKGECDFVVREGTRVKHAVQVCYALNDKNREREVGGLVEAMNEFGLKEGTILTFEQETEMRESGKRIKVIPAWKWLLGFVGLQGQ